MAEEKPEKAEAEVVETEALAVRDNATVVALERASIDQQITTAKAYPRSIEEFKANCLTMATTDQETAESMYYQLPRDGKLIEGPSIRLAEIAGLCWGNMRSGAEVVEVGDDYLVAQGRCHDLQRNVDIGLRVRRRIVNKYGKRYGVDMIATTGMAACSIALRNVILKVVPMAYVKPVMEAAKRVAGGDEKTLTARRDAALGWFASKNVKPEWIFSLLDVKGKEDIGIAEIAKLTGVRNAIRDGEATLQEFFEPIITKPGVVTVDSLKGAAKVQKPESPTETKPEAAKPTETKPESPTETKPEAAKPEPAPEPTKEAAPSTDEAPKTTPEPTGIAAKAASLFD